MLVLTRKLDEAIRISDDIKITILRVKGNTVRIGIEAPRAVRVVRDELESTGSSTDTSGAANGPQRVAKSASLVAGSKSKASAGSQPARLELLSHQELLGSEELLDSEDEDAAVVATVVDSPQPSTSRLFVGKVRVDSLTASLKEHDGSDQAAPLRAFLRSGRKLQSAG